MLVSLLNIKKKKTPENMSWNFQIEGSSYSFTYQRLILPLFYFHSQPLTSHMCRECPWCPGMLSNPVQFSCSVVSDSSHPLGLQHVRLCGPSQLLEPTQTQVHCIGDAIQPYHPLLSPSAPAFNPSQDQGLFQWVSYSYQVAKVLEFQLQHQSFHWIFRTDFL